MGVGCSFFWISGDTFLNRKQNCSFKLSYQLMKHTHLLSPGNPLPHVHFPISFSTPFLVFAVQKAQTESGKRSLPTEKELSSRHLCLHTTDQSYAQDSANLQQYVLLRNKLVTQVVIRATEGFNLQCNNVATQVEEKGCPYYRTLNGEIKSSKYMFFKTVYPNLFHGCDFLCFNLMIH